MTLAPSRARRIAAILLLPALGLIALSLPASSGASGAAVASLDLSHGDLYDSLAVVGAKLILSGGPNGSPFTSGSFADLSSAASDRCHSAVVDPASLALSDARSGSCKDPRLYGVRVMVVNHVDNGTRRGSTISIAHATASGYALGPVVMTYSEASDTDAEWVYGDGSLWIYAPTTTHGSELLRVSEATGAVLQRVPMPWVDRPLLTTDADGLWLAPAVNSGFQPISATGIYRVAPGMTRPILVRRIRWSVRWMVAAGHSVWVDVNRFPQPQALWRLDGGRANAKPVVNVSLGSPLGLDVEFGSGRPNFAGDGTAGIWTVLPQQPNRLRQEVVRVDPATGRSSTVASIVPNYVMPYALTPVVVLDGAVFFLDPPAHAATYPYAPQGFSALYRVGAPQASAAAASCVPRGPRTAVIASNGGTVVYRVRTTTADTWWVCRAGGGRRARVGVDDSFQSRESEYGPSSTLTRLRVAGGWATATRETGRDIWVGCTKYQYSVCPGPTDTLVVVNARSGRRGIIEQFAAETLDDTGGGTQVDWLRTVLSPAGGVAWLLRGTTYSASGAATVGVPTLKGCIVRATAGGVGCAPLTLAQENVDPASLRVSGTTLSWTTDGQPRSASLASI